MAVKIITDSCADLPREVAAARGIHAVIPMRVLFDQEEFLDGITITPPEFFQKLRESPSLPQTSQPNVTEFVKVFTEELGDEDEIVAVLLSSELSGTVQAANLAREMVAGKERIHIVDTRTFTLPQAAMVLRAVERRDAGASAAEIAEELTALQDKSRFYTIIGDLEYLRKGGRLSGAGAKVGTLLHVKPTIEVRDGKVVIAFTSLGLQKAIAKLVQTVKKDVLDCTMPFAISHAGGAHLVSKLHEAIAETIDLSVFPEILTHDVGVVTGSHSGPDCVGLAYFVK